MLYVCVGMLLCPLWKFMGIKPYSLITTLFPHWKGGPFTNEKSVQSGPPTHTHANVTALEVSIIVQTLAKCYYAYFVW